MSRSKCRLRAGQSFDVDFDLVAFPRPRRLQRSCELFLVLGHLARDPEASVGAQDPEAAATRTRPVDEEVDEPVLRGLLGLLRRTELEERTLQLVDALARRARDAEHTHDPVVLELEGRRLFAEVDLVQDDRLWALLELGTVRGELVIDRRETLDGIAL